MQFTSLKNYPVLGGKIVVYKPDEVCKLNAETAIEPENETFMTCCEG